MLEVNSPAESRPQDGLTIAEAARRTGVSVHTLRYYERAGMVATVDRTSGGRRRYQQADLEWIIVCTKLRATGMPIKRIQLYAQLVSRGTAMKRSGLPSWKPIAPT